MTTQAIETNEGMYSELHHAEEGLIMVTVEATPLTTPATRTSECYLCSESLGEDPKNIFQSGYPLSCNHCFHRNCLDQWLQYRSTCPVCNEPLATATPVQKREEMVPLEQSGVGSQPPPFGLPEGGVWGTNTHHGAETCWSAAICCVFCGGIPALVVCCFPFDKRRAYLVNGKVYDGNGVYIGSDPSYFVDEEFDGIENKEQMFSAIGLSSVVAFIFLFLYLIIKLN